MERSKYGKQHQHRLLMSLELNKKTILCIDGWVRKSLVKKEAPNRQKHFRNGGFHQRFKTFAITGLTTDLAVRGMGEYLSGGEIQLF